MRRQASVSPVQSNSRLAKSLRRRASSCQLPDVGAILDEGRTTVHLWRAILPETDGLNSTGHALYTVMLAGSHYNLSS